MWRLGSRGLDVLHRQFDEPNNLFEIGHTLKSKLDPMRAWAAFRVCLRIKGMTEAFGSDHCLREPQVKFIETVEMRKLFSVELEAAKPIVSTGIGNMFHTEIANTLNQSTLQFGHTRTTTPTAYRLSQLPIKRIRDSAPNPC